MALILVAGAFFSVDCEMGGPSGATTPISPVQIFSDKRLNIPGQEAGG